jgi:polyisoprenoid-binding protein YceI
MQTPQRFRLDPGRSTAAFRGKKLGFVPVSGDFGQSIAGQLVMHGDLVDASGTVDARSVSTGMRKRNRHLASVDFLDADEHPELALAADGIPVHAREAEVDARLTIRGVTATLPLTVSVDRVGDDLHLRASGPADRTDLGIKPPPLWHLLVGERLWIDIDLVATREETAQ